MSMKPRIILLIALSFFFNGLTQANTMHTWEVYSLSFKSARIYSNPYADIPVTKGNDLLTVTFRGTGGKAKNLELKVAGFWRGGSEWRVNFAPPAAGRWAFESVSTDKGLNGKKGSFDVLEWTDSEKVSNPVRNGFIRVNKGGENAGHYFEYSDGLPFLWIGDTWWNWTDSRIYFETFKHLVDDRSAKGFNLGQLFVPGNGWGRESSLLDETYSILDTAHASKVEKMIKYANSKGITIWIHGWWSRKNMDSTVGAEKIERWWRYLVHRFAAYNVVWVLAGEYNMNNYGGFKPEFWKELGKLVRNEDPYERILSVHNTPPFWEGGAEAPQWSTATVFHNEDWLDYNQSQVGHGKFANEMVPFIVSEDYKLTPAKPVVVTEPWYEFIEGNAEAIDIRFAAWSAILSGAAGHTYGGGHVWLADVPEAPADESREFTEKGFSRSTYDYEGAVSMKYLSSFFKNIKWWKLKPHPELVQEYPQPFCMAKPGEEYVVYLRYGGVCRLKIEKSQAADELIYQWYDPATGRLSEPGTINGSGLVEFSSPDSYPESPHYKDWVLHVYRKY
jgi:hypothetical protein